MHQKISKGKILLAEPFMLDPNFKRGAILLCEHNEEGSLGFVINKELTAQVSDLLYDFPEFDAPVFFGGPVQEDTIHFLHNVGDLLEDSQEVGPGVFWGGNFEKLKFLISSNLITPDNIRFFLGYSGWSPGQLEEELKLGSWIIADMFSNYVFKSAPSDLWQQIMEIKGDAYSVIAQMPDSVNWN